MKKEKWIIDNAKESQMKKLKNSEGKTVYIKKTEFETMAEQIYGKPFNGKFDNKSDVNFIKKLEEDWNINLIRFIWGK